MKYKRKDVRKVFILRYIDDGVSFSQKFYSKEIMDKYIRDKEIDVRDIFDCKVTESYFLKITD